MRSVGPIPAAAGGLPLGAGGMALEAVAPQDPARPLPHVGRPETESAPASGPALLGAPSAEPRTASVGRPALSTRAFHLHYGALHALKGIDIDMPELAVTAIIGPSGCGKSTLLRSFNRMNDLIPNVRVQGEVRVAGIDVFAPATDVVELRRRVGMVFQRPNPFPKSIFENVAFGLRMLGLRDRSELESRVETALRQASLWDEVKDTLQRSALQLSGGQQQRLCIARALAIEPEVLLMDEPASALDPTATARIEELLLDLKRRYTLVVVTHNMQQAARISDRTAFMLSGNLIEYDETSRIFTSPREKLTEDYITGRFG